MQNLDKKPELLAPAGDIECLKQAIFGGADAVYFGADKFNARIKADNFVDIEDAIRFCHLHNVKAYITINTMIKNAEIEDIITLLIRLENANADAIIIADLGVAVLACQYAPNVLLHASTQMGIHNRLGAIFLKKLGFSRIVLSRETTKEDIIDIKTNVDIELEYFVHGALCMGFSGGCLFSSILSGKSGNRGGCLQLCRHKFAGESNGKTTNFKYNLSTSDLCLLSKLKDLASIGINSFKIEGRLRRVEYVASTVQAYRNVIDNNYISSDKDIDNLKKVFNRGEFTQGYLYDNAQKIMSTNVNSNIGVKIGNIASYKNNILRIKTSEPIHLGDGFKIIDKDIEIGSLSTINFEDEGNNNYSFISKDNYPIGAKIFRTTDVMFNDLVLKKKTLVISIIFIAKVGLPIKLSVTFGELTVSLVGSTAEIAKTASISKDKILSVLSRINDTPFSIKNIDIDLDDKCFVSISDISSLRRNVIAKLEDAIINKYPLTKCLPIDILSRLPNLADKFKGDILEVSILDNLLPNNAIIVYKPVTFNSSTRDSILQFRLINNSLLFISSPIMATRRDIDAISSILKLNEVDGIFANNYYAIELGLILDKKIIVGYNLNIANNYNPLIQLSYGYIISTELNKSEIYKFPAGAIVYSYGYLPLMHLRNCPNQYINDVSCKDCKGYKLSLIDSKNIKFAFSCQKNDICLHTMHNSVITDITEYRGNRYIDMSDKFDINVYQDIISRNYHSNGEFTRNHYNRGVQ